MEVGLVAAMEAVDTEVVSVAVTQAVQVDFNEVGLVAAREAVLVAAIPEDLVNFTEADLAVFTGAVLAAVIPEDLVGFKEADLAAAMEVLSEEVVLDTDILGGVPAMVTVSLVSL